MNKVQSVTVWLDLILRYGPALVELAKRIYDFVEEWADRRKNAGVTPTGVMKAQKFDEVLSRERSISGKPELLDTEVIPLREGAWALKNKAKADYRAVRVAMGK